MQNELVSIIIPTYNRENTLMRAISSILLQTYRNFELIIVDDNSDDKTEELVKSIQDKRIYYIKSDINLGPSEARNLGIRNAAGSYIAFQDSDDYWEESKLEKQMHIMRSDPLLGLIYTGFTNTYDDGRKKYIPSKSIDLTLKEGYIYESLLESNKIGTPTMLVKKECIYNVGMFEKKIYALEDWELSIRIAKKYKIGFIDEALVQTYTSTTGVNSNIDNIIEALCYLIELYKSDFSRLYLLGEKINEIIEYAICSTNSKIEYIQNRLVPNIIENVNLFDAIVQANKKTYKYKVYYDILMKIERINDIQEFIKLKMEKNNWNNVAIYGLGGIGEVVFKYLTFADIPIVYGIDRNLTSLKKPIRMVYPNQINDEADVILVTPVNNYNSIAKELRAYTKAQIVPIDTFFDI